MNLLLLLLVLGYAQERYLPFFSRQLIRCVYNQPHCPVSFLLVQGITGASCRMPAGRQTFLFSIGMIKRIFAFHLHGTPRNAVPRGRGMQRAGRARQRSLFTPKTCPIRLLVRLRTMGLEGVLSPLRRTGTAREPGQERDDEGGEREEKTGG